MAVPFTVIGGSRWIIDDGNIAFHHKIIQSRSHLTNISSPAMSIKVTLDEYCSLKPLLWIIRMEIDQLNVYRKSSTDVKLNAVELKSYILDKWKRKNNKAEVTVTIIYTCIYIRLHWEYH